MQRLFAIAWLTWKAAFRFRLFLVVAVLLLLSLLCAGGARIGFARGPVPVAAE